MFEDFSFSPRSARLPFDDDRLMVDSDSSLISPLSSRCPSPQPSQHQQQYQQQQRFPRQVRSERRWRQPPPPPLPPTSVPFAYDHRRLSIGTLTRKLHEHTLQPEGEKYNNAIHPQAQLQLQVQVQGQTQEDVCVSPRSIPELVPGSGSRSAARIPGYFLTPPDTDHDDEDGDYISTASQSPFLSPTSIPSPTAHAPAPGPGGGTDEAQAHTIRTQRQHISRMQCNAPDIEALRRALLTTEEDPTDHFASASGYGYGQDDCHPSSLPLRLSPRRRRAVTLRSRSRSRSRSPVGLHDGQGLGMGQGQMYRGRRKSSSGALPHAHRIEKNHYTSTRDLRKKSEQGLRRKSLVSAALASMVERVL